MYSYMQVILSARMFWLHHGIGFTLLTLPHLNPLTYLMMILRISHFSLILEEEGSVISHLRSIVFLCFYLLILASYPLFILVFFFFKYFIRMPFL